MGVVPQETALYEELSAAENLTIWGGLYGAKGKAKVVVAGGQSYDR